MQHAERNAVPSNNLPVRRSPAGWSAVYRMTRFRRTGAARIQSASLTASTCASTASGRARPPPGGAIRRRRSMSGGASGSGPTVISPRLPVHHPSGVSPTRRSAQLAYGGASGHAGYLPVTVKKLCGLKLISDAVASNVEMAPEACRRMARANVSPLASGKMREVTPQTSVTSPSHSLSGRSPSG